MLHIWPRIAHAQVRIPDVTSRMAMGGHRDGTNLSVALLPSLLL
jgi:hypothetical protein